MFTVEELKQQLAELRAGLQQLQAQLLQQQGAIMLAEQMLQRAREKAVAQEGGDGEE